MSRSERKPSRKKEVNPRAVEELKEEIGRWAARAPHRAERAFRWIADYRFEPDFDRIPVEVSH